MLYTASAGDMDAERMRGGEEDVQPRGGTAGHNGPAGRMAQ